MPCVLFTGWFGLVFLESRTSSRGLPRQAHLSMCYTLGSSVQLPLHVLLISRENFAKIYLMSQCIHEKVDQKQSYHIIDYFKIRISSSCLRLTHSNKQIVILKHSISVITHV